MTLSIQDNQSFLGFNYPTPMSDLSSLGGRHHKLLLPWSTNDWIERYVYQRRTTNNRLVHPWQALFLPFCLLPMQIVAEDARYVLPSCRTPVELWPTPLRKFGRALPFLCQSLVRTRPEIPHYNVTHQCWSKHHLEFELAPCQCCCVKYSVYSNEWQ